MPPTRSPSIWDATMGGAPVHQRRKQFNKKISALTQQDIMKLAGVTPSSTAHVVAELQRKYSIHPNALLTGNTEYHEVRHLTHNKGFIETNRNQSRETKCNRPAVLLKPVRPRTGTPFEKRESRAASRLEPFPRAFVPTKPSLNPMPPLPKLCSNQESPKKRRDRRLRVLLGKAVGLTMNPSNQPVFATVKLQRGVRAKHPRNAKVRINHSKSCYDPSKLNLPSCFELICHLFSSHGDADSSLDPPNLKQLESEQWRW